MCPSIENQRTGQILGAYIIIYVFYILGRIRQYELFDKAGLSFLNF